MKTKISQMREVLREFGPSILDKQLVQKMIKNQQATYIISDLSRYKLISPIKKGETYLNLLCPKKLSREAILGTYMGEKLYMIGGLGLYNSYGYTTQVADRITVYNTTLLGKKIIAGAKCMFRKVRPSFFRGKQERTADGIIYCTMTRERALIELIKETDGKPEFAEDIYESIEKGEINSSEILSLSQQHTSAKLQHLVSFFLTGSIR